MFETGFILFHAILSKMVFVKARPEKQLFFKNLIIQFISHPVEGEKFFSLCACWKAYLTVKPGSGLPRGDFLGVQQAALIQGIWGLFLAAWTLTCWVVERKLLTP